MIVNFTKAVIAASVAFALGVTAAVAETEKELYEKAKKEGSVVWYGSVSVKAGTPLSKAFEKKYPGVKVEFLRQGSSSTYQRVIQELKVEVHNADVMSTTVIPHYLDLKKRGELMKYRPPEAKGLLPVFQKHGDDYFQISFVGLVFLAYNPDLIKPEDVPKSWKDLLQSKYKSKVSMANPQFSGYGAVTTLAQRNLYGMDYFKSLLKNDPHLTRSSNDTVKLVIAGERPVAMAPSQAAYRNIARGNPIKIVYPSDGAVLQLGPSAILAKAPHPNAAKLLFNYFLSKEGNAIMTSKQYEAIRADVPPPKGGKRLNEVKTVRPNLKQLIEEMPKVKEEFRDIFGI